MQRLSRLKQSIYEASVRDIHTDVLSYAYKNFWLNLKDGRLAKYPLLVMFFVYVYILFPGLKSKLCDKDSWKNLPFGYDIDSIEDLTDGNTKLVFKITLNSGKSYVVKFNKSTIGISPEDITDIGTFDKAEYDTVREWYSGLDVVHTTHYLIVNTPIGSLPAAASVQEFLDSDLVDLFDYMDCPEDLIMLATNHPVFAEQLLGFIDRTLDLYTLHNRSIDLIGRRNVAINFDEINGINLKILDAECLIFYYDGGLIPGSEMEILKRKMEFLSNLKQGLLSRYSLQNISYKEG